MPMTQATRKLTFEEYARLEAQDWHNLELPEGRCEFIDGELIEVPSESEPNDWLANLIMILLANSGLVSARLIRPHSCEVEVSGKPRTWFPDLVILREEHLSLTQRRLLIRRDMPPPVLVVEVLSPNNENRKRDLVDKRQQYAERGIPEYWLCDRAQQSITVLKLEKSQYVEHGIFQGNTPIHSPTLGELPFTAAQIFGETP
jgi:Uma2 family endonuclease